MAKIPSTGNLNLLLDLMKVMNREEKTPEALKFLSQVQELHSAYENSTSLGDLRWNARHAALEETLKSSGIAARAALPGGYTADQEAQFVADWQARDVQNQHPEVQLTQDTIRDILNPRVGSKHTMGPRKQASKLLGFHENRGTQILSKLKESNATFASKDDEELRAFLSDIESNPKIFPTEDSDEAGINALVSAFHAANDAEERHHFAPPERKTLHREAKENLDLIIGRDGNSPE